VAAVNEKTRTPTAGGFQLVELVCALRRVDRKAGDEKRSAAWQERLGHAERRILEALKGMLRKHAELSRKGFRRYTQELLGRV
jgi:hypothetical protein